MRLNVGCGTEYREGWVNLDACGLFRRDETILLPREKLSDKFGKGVADEVLARDFIEHFFRWEGIEVLKDFFEVLKVGGRLEVTTPDLGRLIPAAMPLTRKMELIRGAQGQDYLPSTRPQGVMETAWKTFPEWFAHKYLWSEGELCDMICWMGFKISGVSWRGPESMTVVAFKETP